MRKFTRMALAVGLAAGISLGAVSQAQAAVQKSCSPPEDLNKVWLTVYQSDTYYRWSATKYFKEVRSFMPDQHWYWRYVHFQQEKWTSTAASGTRYGDGAPQNVIGHWKEVTNGFSPLGTYWNCGVYMNG